MRKINKRKARRNRLILCVICLVMIVGIVALFNRQRIELWKMGYSYSQQSIILKSDDYSHYLNHKIDMDAWDQTKNKQHYYDYDLVSKKLKLSKSKTVAYVDGVYSYIPSLEKLDYSKSTIRTMMKQNISVAEFKALASSKVDYPTAKKYMSISGFVYSDLKKYVASKKEPLQAILTVSHAQINSKNKVTRNYTIPNPNSYTTLVKKGYGMEKNYAPKDLVTVKIDKASSDTPNKMRKAAAKALESMASDANKKGLHLVIKSAYRSYSQQQEIYDQYHSEYDSAMADTLVAKPGVSEHQLGLGVDMTSQSVVDGDYGTFGETKEYTWMTKNAYKYGFILRYPSSKTSLTGTSNEPWHYRYVGKAAAKECYENKWTLEDYILHHGFDYQLKYAE